LKISCDKQNTIETRLNAAIQLKNYTNFWKFGDNNQINKSLLFNDDDIIIIISEIDKSLIRKNILEIATNCEEYKIIKLYNEVILRIVKYDFRSGYWPELIPTIQNLLNTQNEKYVLSGVSVLFQATKAFEFESGDYKQKLREALSVFFPILTKIMGQVLPNYKLNEAAYIIKKILDVYVSSIKVYTYFITKIYKRQMFLYFLLKRTILMCG